MGWSSIFPLVNNLPLGSQNQHAMRLCFLSSTTAVSLFLFISNLLFFFLPLSPFIAIKSYFNHQYFNFPMIRLIKFISLTNVRKIINYKFYFRMTCIFIINRGITIIIIIVTNFLCFLKRKNLLIFLIIFLKKYEII